jgi:F-type H+-transporting ATPase subunit alpha
MSLNRQLLDIVLNPWFEIADRVLEDHEAALHSEDIGTVRSVGNGIAWIDGLTHVGAEEVVRFPGNLLGMTFNLDPGQVGIVLLDRNEDLQAGDEVRRSGRVTDVPVGQALIGRVVDPAGRPLDGRGPVRTDERLAIEQPAPAIMDRAAVEVPLQTGLKVVDALIPIGRGQRELILGDRQTGKTSLAVDTIINQHDQGVLCIYCAIGQRSSAVAKVVDDLRQHDAMDYTTVLVASGEDPPGLRFIAPYSATTIGEYWRDRSRDVLVVYDDLTRHARAYRELSLLLHRPPGREAYPGDIFYIHSRLLERATHLADHLGGGSLTALPIIETQAQNISAYVPTNLISITDGQVYLSPELFQKGILPAVDVGRSVSRVGGKTQLPAYQVVAGDLRLSYSQFEELEDFSRFGTRLDEATRQALRRGRRVREVLQQPERHTIPVPEQIAVLLAVTEGVFDNLDLGRVAVVERAMRTAVREQLPKLSRRISEGEQLSQEDRERLLKTTCSAIPNHEDRRG